MSSLEQEENLLRLKIDLAVREDNKYAGSRLGGNASQLYFLITNHVQLQYGTKFKFGLSSKDEIVLLCPKSKVPCSEMRQALDEFYQEHPNRKNVTPEELVNISFLKDSVQSTEIKLLIKALGIGEDVASWMKFKNPIHGALSVSFKRERDALCRQMLRELDLPEDYFASAKIDYDAALESSLADANADKIDSIMRARGASKNEVEHHLLSVLLKEHPIYAPKFKAIEERHDEMKKHLLSQEDWNKLILLSAMPGHIFTLVIRSAVKVDNIVRFELDLNEPLAHALSRVNSYIE